MTGLLDLLRRGVSTGSMNRSSASGVLPRPRELITAFGRIDPRANMGAGATRSDASEAGSDMHIESGRQLAAVAVAGVDGERSALARSAVNRAKTSARA